MLVYQIPSKPTNLRVRVWRKLQIFGSVLVKNSVYVLPFNEKTNEDFQWLRQEIESAGGEASVFRADSIEGATDKELVAEFRRQRDEDYSRVIAELNGLSGTVHEQKRAGSLSTSKLGQYESDLGKLSQELERILETDFFHAPNGEKAKSAFEKCRKELQAAKCTKGTGPSLAVTSAKLDTAEYQNRRWVTRKDPHIDRLASAWFVKRFIDKRPRFGFVSEGTSTEGSVSFDMVGADFTHRGEDCSFETLMKSFGLDHDSALRQIAEIVHDVDLKDGKFNRLEANGVNAVIRGLAAAYRDDNERLKKSLPLFDGLYELFNSSNASTDGTGLESGKKERGRRRK